MSGPVRYLFMALLAGGDRSGDETVHCAVDAAE